MEWKIHIDCVDIEDCKGLIRPVATSWNDSTSKSLEKRGEYLVELEET